MSITIESTKTTSMDDVSTGVKNIYLRIKDKAKKNYMMYQDIYDCICRNTKKWRYTIQYVKPTAQLVFNNRFPKGGQTGRRQVVNPRHQTSQGQSVAKPETPLQNKQINLRTRFSVCTLYPIIKCAHDFVVLCFVYIIVPCLLVRLFIPNQDCFAGTGTIAWSHGCPSASEIAIKYRYTCLYQTTHTQQRVECVHCHWWILLMNNSPDSKDHGANMKSM